MDCLKLSAYSEAFRKEGITGDLLLELDELALEQDLGVSSRLHRLNIMRFITGKYSARSSLQEDGDVDGIRPETAEYLTPVESTQSDKTVST